MSLSLPGPHTPMSMPAGSTHAHPHRVRTHARTGPTHACTGPMHACLHRVPTPARLQGPCTHARTGSLRPLACGAHLACSHQVPTPTWSPCTHALGPHAHSLPGSPRKHALGHACTLAPGHARTLATGPHARSHGLHARVHWAYAHTLAPGSHARSLAGSPCTCAGSLHLCMLHPMLYVVVVLSVF